MTGNKYKLHELGRITRIKTNKDELHELGRITRMKTKQCSNSNI